MPGVAVTAASPQLIEQTRTVVTDGTGNYRFIALPAGTYSVTFQLSGFGTVVREGVVLEGAFVADVDAQLAVGNVQESITVSGAAPLVDVVSTRDQIVLTADQVNALPASSSIISGMQYVPGVRGNFVAVGGAAEGGAKLHGSDGADSQSHIDGVETGTQLGSRSNFVGGVGLVTDQANVGEMVYDTGAQGAEFAQSGVRTNMIPKAGGNTFSGDVFLSGGHENFADSNISPELEEDGFAFSPTAYNYSFNPSFGGPIKENKLWFFGSFVYNKSKTFRNGIFFEPDEPSTPDGQGDDLRAIGEPRSEVARQLDETKIRRTNTTGGDDPGDGRKRVGKDSDSEAHSRRLREGTERPVVAQALAEPGNCRQQEPDDQRTQTEQRAGRVDELVDFRRQPSANGQATQKTESAVGQGAALQYHQDRTHRHGCERQYQHSLAAAVAGHPERGQQQQGQQVGHSLGKYDRRRGRHGDAGALLEQIRLQELADLARGNRHGQSGHEDG